QKKLEEKLASDPADKRARRDLVDHHVKAKEFARAIEVLEEGLSADADAFELRERLGDVRILDYEQQIRGLKALADRGDQAAKTDLVDLTREKRAFEIEEVTRRVKDHPTDLE